MKQIAIDSCDTEETNIMNAKKATKVIKKVTGLGAGKYESLTQSIKAVEEKRE